MGETRVIPLQRCRSLTVAAATTSSRRIARRRIAASESRRHSHPHLSVPVHATAHAHARVALERSCKRWQRYRSFAELISAPRRFFSNSHCAMNRTLRLPLHYREVGWRGGGGLSIMEAIASANDAPDRSDTIVTLANVCRPERKRVSLSARSSHTPAPWKLKSCVCISMQLDRRGGVATVICSQTEIDSLGQFAAKFRDSGQSRCGCNERRTL